MKLYFVRHAAGMVVCLKMPPTKQKAQASLKWVMFEGKKIDVPAPGVDTK